ncbi:MAG: zinc-binding dehydrogenase [Candidatus Omnitrophica bacterium]|nr:zinc-binding dehydrogenase [Candidatus Omnitrophota bacterium]
MKTKVLIFPEANRFEVSELTLEQMSEDDIKVRTIISAISPGTERWILKGKHIGTKFPCAPGYHRIGIVEEIGKNVKCFKEGDIVYGTDNKWKENVYRMWGAHIFYSIGNYKNYWFISSKIPNEFELETIVFTQLSAVATRGIKALKGKPKEKIIIIGAGFLGLCACQLSIYKNMIPILIDKDPKRVKFGKKFTSFSFSIDDKDIDEKLKEIAPEGFDYLYDTVGIPETTDKLVKFMKYRGKILLQAQYFDKERCAIDLDQIKIRELTIKTTIGIDTVDFYETLEYIKKRIIKISEMITHRFKDDELEKGFEILRDGKEFNLGILFWWK